MTEVEKLREKRNAAKAAMDRWSRRAVPCSPAGLAHHGDCARRYAVLYLKADRALLLAELKELCKVARADYNGTITAACVESIIKSYEEAK